MNLAKWIAIFALALVACGLVYFLTPSFASSPLWSAAASVRVGTMPTVNSIVSPLAEFELVEDIDTLSKRLSMIPRDESSATVRVVATDKMSARIFVTGKNRDEVERAMADTLQQFKTKEDDVVKARREIIALAMDDVEKRASEMKAISDESKGSVQEVLPKISIDRLGDQRLKFMILLRTSQPYEISDVIKPALTEFPNRRILLSLFAAVATALISLGIFVIIGRWSIRSWQS